MRQENAVESGSQGRATITVRSGERRVPTRPAGLAVAVIAAPDNNKNLRCGKENPTA